jgi:hypothetical protein
MKLPKRRENDRKTVDAHSKNTEAMGEALGYTRVANHLGAKGGVTIDTYSGSKPAERGERFSSVGQGHVYPVKDKK